MKRGWRKAGPEETPGGRAMIRGNPPIDFLARELLAKIIERNPPVPCLNFQLNHVITK